MDSIHRLGVDSEHDPELVRQRASEDDKALVHEVVHERRVRRPAGLLLEPARRVPLRPRAVPYDEEHGTLRTGRGSLELGDVDLLHSEHRPHRALRPRGIGIGKQLMKPNRVDLP
jgi:hypothetical protein